MNFPVLIDVIPGKLQARIYVHNIKSRAGSVPCWSYVTEGLSSLQQNELVFTLRRNADEQPSDYPEMILALFKEVYSRAEQGHFVEVGTITDFGPAGFLGHKDAAGLVFVNAQPLKGVVIPTPSLAAIMLMGDELKVAQGFGLTRVAATLGMAYGYYPFPSWSDRSRSSSVSLKTMQEHSVLAKIQYRRWFRNIWIRVEGGNRIILSILPEARSEIEAILKGLPADSPLALITELDPRADSCLVWKPGQSQQTIFAADKNDRTILTANFVLFLPGQRQGKLMGHEDGFALFLTDPSWSAIKHALEAGSNCLVPMTDDGATISVEWVDAAYPDNAGKWRALNNRLYELFGQGKYAQATPLAEEAVRRAEADYGPDHLQTAFALNNLSEAYRFDGNYGQAEPHAKRALQIREESLRPNHFALAESLNVLGSIYENLGKYSDGEPLYQRSIAILEEHLGKDDPNVASGLNDLAGLYAQQGKYAEAEPLHLRALAIDEKSLGREHRNVARDLDNIGLLYEDQGKHAEAEPLRQRALAVYQKALGEEHPEVATALNNLAGHYLKDGKYTQAESLYKRALVILEKAFGQGNPQMATSLGNLASLYGAQGRYSEAEPLIGQALIMHEEALGKEHPLVAIDLSNLADVFVRQSRFAEAEQLLQRGLAIRERAFGTTHPDVAFSLIDLALLHYVQGNCTEAEHYFEWALQNVQWQFEYQFTYMSEKDRLSFLYSHGAIYPIYLSFCFTHAAQFPYLAGKMFDAVLWMKGLVASSMAAVQAKIVARGDKEALPVFRRLAAQRAALASLFNHPTKHLGQWHQAMERLKKECNDLESRLVRHAGDLVEEKKPARLTWEDVRATLKADEAAVEVGLFAFHDGKHWTDEFYYVALIVLPETTATPILVLLGDAASVEHAPLEWKPLESVLAQTKRIYLSPDGVLNQIPLSLMKDDEGRLLMEKYDLRIVSSTKDLLREKRSVTNRSAVLIGNPKFELGEAQQRAAVARFLPKGDESEPSAPTLGSGLRSRDQRGEVLRPLPGTKVEIESIQGLLQKQGWQVEMYTEEKATEEAVKNVKSPMVLHVATHGFFLPDQKKTWRTNFSHLPSGLEDPMLRSGLYFAGAGRTLAGSPPVADLEDGILTAYEASSLNLHGTELVVLSACNTGRGHVATGEGIFGLRRALQLAGAESVLMSLWPVPDLETQELMLLFYSKWLAGRGKHEALREAQLEMRDKVVARYGSDRPTCWGGFVLVGR